MSDLSDSLTKDKARVGLCVDCVHARRIESDRGSIFFLCQLALTDGRFQKYPLLPVFSCPGYEKELALRGYAEQS